MFFEKLDTHDVELSSQRQLQHQLQLQLHIAERHLAVAKFEPVACHSLLHAASFTTARQCVALRLHQLMIVASLVPVQLNKGLPVFTGTLRLRSTQSLHPALTPGVTRNRAIGRRPRTVKEHQHTISAALSDLVTTDNMPEAQSSMLFAAAMPKEEIGALAFLKV